MVLRLSSVWGGAICPTDGAVGFMWYYLENQRAPVDQSFWFCVAGYRGDRVGCWALTSDVLPSHRQQRETSHCEHRHVSSCLFKLRKDSYSVQHVHIRASSSFHTTDRKTCEAPPNSKSYKATGNSK